MPALTGVCTTGLFILAAKGAWRIEDDNHRALPGGMSWGISTSCWVVYLPRGDLTLRSLCIVLDPDQLGPEDPPRQAAELGLNEGLGVDDIRPIRDNVRMQGKRPTDEEMLLAVIHYMRNDAFIVF
jgi:hypothetical protein